MWCCDNGDGGDRDDSGGCGDTVLLQIKLKTKYNVYGHTIVKDTAPKAKYLMTMTFIFI